MINYCCAFTGHRPQRFSFGFDESDMRCVELKRVLAEQVRVMLKRGVTVFLSGMGLGTDQWGAEIVLEEKKNRPDIRLTAILPCEEQANYWKTAQRLRYFTLLEECDHVVTLSGRYTRACMFNRNRALVSRSDFLLAVYDGKPGGGTAYTIKQARKKGGNITIIDPGTLAVTDYINSMGGE